MALTDTQKNQAARNLAKKLFGGGETANLNLDDLRAAVASLDTAMDTTISAIPGAWQNKTIKQALVDNLPEPFQSNSTAHQKALALMIWALAEVG